MRQDEGIGELRHFRPDPRCRLIIHPVPGQPNGPPHRHNLDELVVVRSGAGMHRLEGRDWPIAAGEVFLIRPGSTHRYHRCRDLCLVNLLFEPLPRWLPVGELAHEAGWRALFEVQPGDRPGGRLRLLPGELAEVDGRCRRLEAELAQRRPGWACVAAGELLALVATLVRLWPLRAESAMDARLAELLGYIAADHARPLSSFGLARRAGITQRSLQRLFKSQLGCTPKQHLERVRLDRAAQLLADPRMSVGAVAAAVGFGDPSYFARRWRARFGGSPARSR
jgi:AraC-like DNA-binding protein/mannose-6-phosphate isomerase-like protein (cupin superfamily)